MTPEPSVVRALKEYDKNIHVEWNNTDNYWEIWYKTNWGDRFITPVTEIIYNIKGNGKKFVPLDYRIVDWMYKADTKGKDVPKKWQWLNNHRHMDRLNRQDEKTMTTVKNVIQDHYNMLNKELLNPLPPEDSDWVAPDLQGSDRMMQRSAENVRQMRGEDD